MIAPTAKPADSKLMLLKILGAAAGGGLPQWNCGCQNCADARSGKIPALSQSSVAVSANGRDWLLLNASPDIREQLRFSGLHPQSRRESPIAAVLLTNGDIDHIAGLLCLRESSAFQVFATEATLSVLDQPVFRVLNPDFVSRNAIQLDQSFEPLPGLRVTAFAVPGKVALFMETGEVQTDLMGEQTIGVMLEAQGKRAFYIPGCAEVRPDLLQRLSGADLLLFDGTVWSDDEMSKTGTGVKTGGRMGHIAMAGPHGSLERLETLGETRRYYIHINNTNPVLQPGSAERAALDAAGWTLALDGMEISL